MNIEKSRLNKNINKIIECASTVVLVLGFGFEDKVYERALIHELGKQGFDLELQYPINVYYDGIIVGDFYADILVEDSILVEVVVVDRLTEKHKKKGLNYLAASELGIYLLINFGVLELEVYRLF